jgi:poly(3-hydroxybutyrate) depolymerase
MWDYSHMRFYVVLDLFALGFVFGCSGSENATNTNNSGGSLGVGGTQTVGGSAPIGGASTSGGVHAGGSTSGIGGQSNASSVAVTGGAPATGGMSATGGSPAATGGKSATGGNVSSGGSKAATGGAVNGGASTAGGAVNGGASTTGGAVNGGASTTGGAVNGGASTTGGAVNGGASTTGGTAAGGSTGTSPAGRSSGCNKAPTAITSAQYNNGTTIPITVNGSQRRYILNIPKPYDNTVAYKLVIATHELNGNDKEMYAQNYYGLLPLSNNTTIFAAPNGVYYTGSNVNSPCTGNSSGDSNCGWPAGDNNMALIDAVVAQLEENFCIDTNHIFATGWSYGASMSYEIGCERPLGGPTATANWGVRAVANYAVAQMSGSCKPSSSYPVGYYLHHGTNDSVLTYDGVDPRHTATTGEAGGVGLAKTWAIANGCTWVIPQKVISGNHVCTKFAGCKAGYPVEFCSFNGDHVPFPDSNNQSNTWGPQEVWSFFSQF